MEPEKPVMLMELEPIDFKNPPQTQMSEEPLDKAVYEWKNKKGTTQMLQRV